MVRLNVLAKELLGLGFGMILLFQNVIHHIGSIYVIDDEMID